MHDEFGVLWAWSVVFSSVTLATCPLSTGPLQVTRDTIRFPFACCPQVNFPLRPFLFEALPLFLGSSSEFPLSVITKELALIVNVTLFSSLRSSS